jgi:hypothetical protein
MRDMGEKSVFVWTCQLFVGLVFVLGYLISLYVVWSFLAARSIWLRLLVLTAVAGSTAVPWASLTRKNLLRIPKMFESAAGFAKGFFSASGEARRRDPLLVVMAQSAAILFSLVVFWRMRDVFFRPEIHEDVVFVAVWFVGVAVAFVVGVASLYLRAYVKWRRHSRPQAGSRASGPCPALLSASLQDPAVPPHPARANPQPLTVIQVT